MKLLKNSPKYIRFLPFIILGLTPILWFLGRGDMLINGIDTNFPLNPELWFNRRLFVWNSVTNGGTDFSSSTSGLFFHFVQYLPYKLGLNLQIVQIVSLVFWFFAIVFSSWFLARVIFTRNYLVQLLFVVLYSFNIYLFNSWENVKVANLSLISATPIALATLIQLRNQKINYRKAFLYFLIVAVLISGAGINPAYFATLFLVLGIYTFGEIIAEFKLQNIKDRLRDLLLAGLVIIGINAFWILPTMNFILTSIDPAGSIDKVGFTNWIDSLSENTSILNVTRMQGAWDWYAFDSISGLPLYIPYALNYFHRLPFLVFSFVLPALVMISLVFRNTRKGLYLAFALMFIMGISLGVGTRLPTGDLFRWFLNHLPFFTLFRSPWYIFTILVVLAYAGLIGLLCTNLLRLAESNKWNYGKAGIALFVAILIVGNLVYSYPLVTGKIFRPARHDTFYIQFPDYVFSSSEWLNSQNTGRILSYPDDEIEKFTWRYRGVESILQLASNGEMLFSPLNAPDAPISKLVKTTYKYLKKSELESARTMAEKLGVELLFEKKDQESLSGDLPELIKRDSIASFGNWNFYKFVQSKPAKIYSSDGIYYGYPHTNNPRLLSLIEAGSIVLSPNDAVVKKIPEVEQIAGSVILTDNSQEKEFVSFANSPSTLKNRLLKRDPSLVIYRFNVFEEGPYTLYLERYGLESFGLGESALEVDLDGTKSTLQVEKRDDSYLQFAPLLLGIGSHTISFNIYNPNLITGGDFQGEIGFEKGGYGEGFGEFRIVKEKEEKYLSILNIEKADVSADFKIFSFDPQFNYYMELRYKQIFGNNANVVVLQGNENTVVKAQVERLPNHPEWNVFSFFYQPVETKSYTKISLSSPHITDPLGTKIFYDDLKAFKVFSNDLILVKRGEKDILSKVNVDYGKVSPVKYTGSVFSNSSGHILSFLENYSPEWEFSIKGDQKAKVLHFSSNLYSNSWYIEGAPKEYQFEIFYKPQNYFYIGAAISLITLVAVTYNSWRKRDQ